MAAPIVVVGAGHNGLIAGCYLAREGRDVLVLEARDAPGGGSRTEETVPGYRFDMHSVAHNMITMTGDPRRSSALPVAAPHAPCCATTPDSYAAATVTVRPVRPWS